MKNSAPLFVLALSLLAAACATPTQPAVATPPPLVPSATVAAATPTPPAAGLASLVPTAVPAATTPASPTGAPTETPAAAVAATATANPAVAGGLVGFWQGNNRSFYLLNKDGTWSWDQDGQKVLTAPENQGRWWVEGDIFRIQDLSGLAPCPNSQIGAYQVQLSGDTLALIAVADLCGPRIDQTAGRYSRQPAGP